MATTIESNYQALVNVTTASSSANCSPSNDQKLVKELTARAQELELELQGLRNLPQPISAEELEQSGLLGAFQNTFLGTDENPGLIDIISQMNASTDPYIESFVKNPAFTALENDIEYSDIGGNTMSSAINNDVGDPNHTQLAIFLATILNQTPTILFNDMLKEAGKL